MSMVAAPAVVRGLFGVSGRRLPMMWIGVRRRLMRCEIILSCLDDVTSLRTTLVWLDTEYSWTSEALWCHLIVGVKSWTTHR